MARPMMGGGLARLALVASAAVVAGCASYRGPVVPIYPPADAQPCPAPSYQAAPVPLVGSRHWGTAPPTGAPAPTGTPTLAVPRIATPEPLRAGTLEVSVTGPSTVAVGENVNFAITVTNHGTAPATKLLVTDRFDEGLEHATSPSPIERDLADLGPGQWRKISVTFRAVKAGQLCNEVVVTAEGGLRGQARACVVASAAGAVAQPPARLGLSVEKSGPEMRYLGETAAFVIQIKNTGQSLLTDLVVTDSYDLGLEPVEATENYTQPGDGTIAWRIASLPAGESVKLEVHCECRQAAARTCNRVSVTAKEGITAKDEACVEIRRKPAQGSVGPEQPPGGTGPTKPPTGTGPTKPPSSVGPAKPPAVASQSPKLTMTVADLRDPVASGKDVIYEIQVRNEGETAAKKVVVAVTAPSGMTPLPTVRGPAPSAGITGQVLRFKPVDDIRPGETVQYRVPMRADKPGTYTIHVELTAEGLAQPLTAEEGTEVFSESK